MGEDSIKRLTLALYRVTERMADEEPLKWKLRQHALRFSELESLPESSLSLKEAQERLRLMTNLVSLLDLASSLSYVAKVNFDTLRREYLLFEKSNQSVLLTERAEEKNLPIHIASPEENSNESVSNRQKKILEYLEKTSNSSIGEVSIVFENSISEKTLQRDLSDLMLQGLVRAEGDRRWRKYSLLKTVVSS